MKLTTKLLLNTTLVGLTMMFTGCDNDGSTGAIGETGVTGQAGISCWDLNEDGVKTMPDEDTNKDGYINVMDCRAIPSSPAATTTHVDLTTGAISNKHTRVGNATFLPDPNKIDTYTGSHSDYYTAVLSGDYLSLDADLTDPISDPCGLWKWKEDPSAAGNYLLVAEDTVGYSATHYPISAIDENNESHYGSESCLHSCLADSQCVAATYTPEHEIRTNTMICTKGYKVDIDIAANTELVAMEGSFRGLMVANVELEGGLNSGFISVCENPVVP